jgi:hypothetical protein
MNMAGSGRFRAVAVAVAVVLLASVMGATADHVAAQGVPSAASRPSKSAPRPAPGPRSHPQPTNLPVLDSGYGPTAAQRAAMAAASRLARAGGQPAVVDGLTSETQQVLAEPHGGFALASNPNPVRTQHGGVWVPVDTSLLRNADGTLSPAATAYGTVVLSGGGSGPLVTTTSGRTTYSLSWPSPLPAPAVSGSSATYPEVLPGVDLVVSATAAGGFSDVLVVKSAAAAGNPALVTITMPAPVNGGHAAAGPHGGVTVTGVAGGNVLEAGSALMWDSNASLVAPGKAASRAPAAVAPDASDTSHPGVAARVSTVQARAGGSTLQLTPDRRLLTGSSTVYPVYIDPSFNWHPTTGGTPAFDEVKQGAPCTNTSFFDNSGPGGDNGALGVGVNGWTSCIGIMRAYYQWPIPSVIWGARIGNAGGQPGATVNATKIYSASCATTATVNLHWSGGIGPGTSWNNQPGYSGSIAQADYGPATNPSHCPGNGSVTHGFDVTGAIAQEAAGHASQFAVVLTEDGFEASRNDLGFSRFSDNPTLQISYNLAPNVPGALAAVSGSDNAGCATQTPYPYMGKTITSNTPVLDANVSDPDGDQLQVTFYYWIDGGSTVNTGTSADNLASGTTAQFSLPASFTSSLSNGQVVDWQAQASDGQASGGWSPVCHFIAEPTAPSAPSTTSADGRYPNNGTVGATAGTPGQFTIASTGGTVSGLVDRLDQAPATSNPPAANIPPFTGGAAITPTGHWTLTDGTGTTAADATAAHPATLAGGATWMTDPTRGKVLSFNGTTGYAATNGPVLNTGGSFSIAAWVNVTASTGTSQTLIAQQGNVMGGLYLEYDFFTGHWSFTRRLTDTTNASSVFAESGSAAQLNTWTHLVCVYDAASGTMTLYVNGVASGTATDTTPFVANGPLVIGRGFYNGAPINPSDAAISDVQSYQYVLSPGQISGVQSGAITAPAGRWRFLDGAGASAADSSGGGHPASLTGGAGWTTTPVASVSFDGSTGYAVTGGPVLSTTGSFSVSAWVNVRAFAGAWQTFVVQPAVTDSGFYLEYDGNSNRWSFSRSLSDVPAPNVARAESSVLAQANAWTYLAGVYDASSGAMTLYVNGTASGGATDTTPIASSGPLVIGRGYHSGAADNFAGASITDVQTYQSALGSSEIAQIHASATLGIAPPSPGPHTLYSYAADPAGDVSGYQAYPFVAAGDPSTSCASLAVCFDNTAISPDGNPRLAAADGVQSISATDLANAGWNSGGQVTIDGATFALPAFGAGQPDNVLAANQTVAFNQAIPATGASALSFLTTSTNANTTTPGALNGDDTAPYVPAGAAVAGTYCFDSTNPAAFCAAHGTIQFSDGSSQLYYLTVPDWVLGPAALAAVVLPHENGPSGQITTLNPRLYAFSVPLPVGKTIVSVTLPDVSLSTATSAAGLHIFAMATRDTTTAQAPASQTWTGAWASPSEGNYNFEGGANFANQTFRIALKPSISGGTVRVKLDDALGTSPLAIGHATIALSDGSAKPTGPVAGLTFGGLPSVTIPEGGMVFSDPLAFAVTANQYVLVSFHLANSVPWLVEHSWVDSAIQYASAVGSGDQTADATGGPFSGTGTVTGYWTDVVTDLDVATAGMPTEAVLGDGLVDSWHPNTAARYSADPRLADDVAAAAPTTPGPYGTITEGIRSNQLMADNPVYGGYTLLGPSALTRIDRDILDQPGLTTVVVNQGLEDVLAGRSFADVTGNGYTQLIDYLASYGITVIAVGLSPCDGYAGDASASPNDPCTGTADAERTQVNRWLSGGPLGLSPWTSPAYFFLDADAVLGVPDTANGEVRLNAIADTGDHVNLTTGGYAELASAYLGPQDTWPLNDGAGTAAADTASNAANPYLINNAQVGANPATLNGGASWATDPARGSVLQLDGTTGNATTAGPVVGTTGSFSVSAWVNLAGTAQSGQIVAQDGSQNAMFSLYYLASTGTWGFATCGTDVVGCGRGIGSATAQAGAWTHLVGTYDATSQTIRLYVNGALNQSLGSSPTFAASGPLVIGSGLAEEVSGVHVWNYTLSQAQVMALYQQTTR